MLRSRWRPASIAALTGAAALAACELVVPLSGGPAAGPSDATVDVAARLDPCGPIPEPGDGGPAPSSLPDLLFATSEWSFDEIVSDAGARGFCELAAFNLDQLETRDPGCAIDRACTQNQTGVPAKVACDGPGGVDNAMAKLIESVIKLAPGAEARFDANALLGSGVANVLFELVDYNREADDPDVQVNFYTTAGFAGFTYDAGRPLGFDDVAGLPKVWDGTRDIEWILDERSVKTGLGVKPRFTAPAWVRDYVLVVPSTGAGAVPFGLGGIGYRSGILVARIVPPAPGKKFRLTHGRLGARVPSSVLLGAVGTFGDPFSDGGARFCDPSVRPNYEFLRGSICGALDLPANGAGPNADAPCGDLSFASHFQAVESRVAIEDNVAVVGKSLIGFEAPCASPDGGEQWCDDCAWDASSRCPIDPVQ